MSHNSFGHLFRVTTWGESHGPALGCVVDGCPPGLSLTEADIQFWLDRRRPGGSRFVTQRREPDTVRILSGVFEDDRTGGPRTTGAPISLLIENADQRSKDYASIRDLYRPGHADYVYDAKYGLRDYRGGGRSSARETAARVAAGAVARKIIPGVRIRAALVRIGPIAIDRARWDWAETERNPLWCPDPETAPRWEALLDEVRKKGSSVGAVIEVHASGVPPGWGAPLYAKLDADLAGAMMGINAVKGVEIGAGFAAAEAYGHEHGDAMDPGPEGPSFRTNHAGGVAGGLSTGQDVVVRFAVKPTSSIALPQPTISAAGEAGEVSTPGRHDPCVGVRAAPVGEAMMACVLGDHFLRHRGQTGR